MEATEDGFLIAEKDLELRGGGEVLGARQSGMPGFRVAERAGLRGAAGGRPRRRPPGAAGRPDAVDARAAEALRTLLYLFECDEAVRLFRAALGRSDGDRPAGPVLICRLAARLLGEIAQLGLRSPASPCRPR